MEVASPLPNTAMLCPAGNILALPLLDWFASQITKGRLDDCAVLVHTHILNNNVPLFRHLAYLVGVNRIYVVGKQYSTLESAREELALSGIQVIPVHMRHGIPYHFSVKESLEVLWHKVLEDCKGHSFSKVLILDDGGDIWTSIPWEKIGDLQIAGTEQTQRGISRIQETNLKLPIIVSVATSGIKKEMESVFIAQSVIKKLKERHDLAQQKIGLLGMGSIGRALYSHFLSIGKECLYYDPLGEHYGDGKISSLDELLNESEVIIGSTGTDALKQVPFERVEGKKVLISASSADVEFAAVLQFKKDFTEEPFDDIVVRVSNDLTFTIVNGGYPFNFDRVTDATPDDEIVLTRCLLYLGLMQAEDLLRNEESETGFYNLDIDAQKMLLIKWFQEVPEKAKQFNLENELSNIDNSTRSDFKNRNKFWEVE